MSKVKQLLSTLESVGRSEINSVEDYSRRLSTKDDAYIGDLFDDYFKSEYDPMDRYVREEMLYVINYPNNKDTEEIRKTLSSKHKVNVNQAKK